MKSRRIGQERTRLAAVRSLLGVGRLWCPQTLRKSNRPGGNPGANLKSMTHRFYLREIAFEWELTKETINFPLGRLQGGTALNPFEIPVWPLNPLRLEYNRQTDRNSKTPLKPLETPIWPSNQLKLQYGS